MSPLALQPDRIVIGQDIAATTRIVDLSLERRAVNLCPSLQPAFDQKHLGLTAFVSAGRERTLDAAGLCVLKAAVFFRR